jgi:hypothetical protein
MASWRQLAKEIDPLDQSGRAGAGVREPASRSDRGGSRASRPPGLVGQPAAVTRGGGPAKGARPQPGGGDGGPAGKRKRCSPRTCFSFLYFFDYLLFVDEAASIARNLCRPRSYPGGHIPDTSP